MLHYFGFRAANHVASFAGDLQVSALMKTWSRFLQLAQLQWAQFQPPGGLVKTICEVGGPPRTSQYRTGRKERFMCLCSPNNRGLIANYWSSNAVIHGKLSTGCMIGHFFTDSPRGRRPLSGKRSRQWVYTHCRQWSDWCVILPTAMTEQDGGESAMPRKRYAYEHHHELPSLASRIPNFNQHTTLRRLG